MAAGKTDKQTTNASANQVVNRYEKLILFKKIGKEGFSKIQKTKIAIVGLGALGSVAAEQLIRSGVGKVVLIDQDIVELGNLQRQTLYTEEDINKPKAECAKNRLSKINSEVKIEVHTENLNHENIELIKSDIVVDCTDNLETRFLINEYCAKNKIYWIYGAVAGSQGCVFSIIPDGVCFNCIFDKATPSATCSEDGVISTIVHIIGSLQVNAALKMILKNNNDPETTPDIVFFDVWSNKLNEIKVKKNPECRVCKGEYRLLNPKINSSNLKDKKSGTGELFEIKLCKTKASYSAKPKKHLKMNFDRLRKKYNIKADANILLVTEIEGEDIIIHNFGEITFKGCKNTEKMRRIASEIYSVALN